MTKYHSNRTDYYFWLGASADAETGSRASTEPCSTVSALTGFDPAREHKHRWRGDFTGGIVRLSCDLCVTHYTIWLPS